MRQDRHESSLPSSSGLAAARRPVRSSARPASATIRRCPTCCAFRTRRASRRPSAPTGNGGPDRSVLPEPRHQRPQLRQLSPAERRLDDHARACAAALRRDRRHRSDIPPGRRRERARARRVDGRRAPKRLQHAALEGPDPRRHRHADRAGAEFELVAVDDPYGHASAQDLSLFRRPLPATNLKFLSTVMWDGRETFKDPASHRLRDRHDQLLCDTPFQSRRSGEQRDARARAGREPA